MDGTAPTYSTTVEGTDQEVPAMTTTTPTAVTVLPLTAATDYRIAGRKAATLARLAAAGFPVPPGIVIPAAVFERAFGNSREVPAEIAAALLAAVRAWGEVPLAVRSSGVEEDSADASTPDCSPRCSTSAATTRCSTRSASAGTQH